MKCLFGFALVFGLVCATKPFVCSGQSFVKKELNEYVWDLTPVYSSNAAWEKEFSLAKNKLKSIGLLKSTMGLSAENLAKAMDDIYDLRSMAAKLTIFGMLSSDVNITDDNARRMYETAIALEREVESSVAFLKSEIPKIGEKTLANWINTEPRLKRHGRRINRILWEAPHSTTPEIQSVIESMKGWPMVSADGFFALYESDLVWPSYTNADGAETQISYSNYRSARRSANDAERIDIAKKFLGYVGSLQNILGHLYTHRVTADLVIARHQKFDDGIDALWYLRDGVPEGAYKTMIRAAGENKELLKQYRNALSKILQKKNVGYQDFYAIPQGFTSKLTIQESWDIVLKVLQPLGKTYIDKVKLELSKSDMHLVPMPNKRTFFANQERIAGIPSYSMLTFNGTYGNLRSLIGIAVSKVKHSNIPIGNWPDTRDDPPIYGNAILYVAELLLDDYLISHAASREEKLFHLQNALYRSWVYCFNEVLNAKLDATVQQMVIENKPPSGKAISEAYFKILQEYYAGIEIDSVFANEWMANSVQFLSYENQFWPAAMASACMIHQKLKRGDKNGFDAVDGLIGKGETDLSYGLLKSVGIDMTKPETYDAMYRRMEYLINEMEKFSR